MAAAALPFHDFYQVIPEYQVELSVKRHGDLHIGEKVLEAWHTLSSLLLCACMLIVYSSIPVRSTGIPVIVNSGFYLPFIANHCIVVLS
jgi:hypothetical protein